MDRWICVRIVGSQVAEWDRCAGKPLNGKVDGEIWWLEGIELWQLCWFSFNLSLSSPVCLSGVRALLNPVVLSDDLSHPCSDPRVQSEEGLVSAGQRQSPLWKHPGTCLSTCLTVSDSVVGYQSDRMNTTGNRKAEIRLIKQVRWYHLLQLVALPPVPLGQLQGCQVASAFHRCFTP